MPPKVKITKEDILRVGVELVRSGSKDALTARNIAKRLSCSTQPLFSNFSSMEELERAVVGAAYDVYRKRLFEDMQSAVYPLYKTAGMSYVKFAGEEKELFRFLFMRDRIGEDVLTASAEFEQMVDIVRSNTGLSRKDAYMFQQEMWVFVHGLAVMVATGFLPWDDKSVSMMLTDVFEAMKKQYAVGDANP